LTEESSLDILDMLVFLLSSVCIVVGGIIYSINFEAHLNAFGYIVEEFWFGFGLMCFGCLIAVFYCLSYEEEG